MNFKVLVSLLAAATVAHADDKSQTAQTPQAPQTLEEAAKNYKPTYKTNFSTDMMAFMKNSPIYNGLGFVYVNPNGVSPQITQSVICNTTTVNVPVTTTTTVTVPYTYTVPVTTTWTTTSVVQTQVVTPYTITSSTSSFNIFGAVDTYDQTPHGVGDVTNSILQNITNSNQNGHSTLFGGSSSDGYWVIHGAPTSAQDVATALGGAGSGNALPFNWDSGHVDVTAWTVSNVTNPQTAVSISTPASYTDSNGVTFTGRTITTTTYTAVEDRYNTEVYMWKDTNGDGIVDEGDQIYTKNSTQQGQTTTITVTETGEKVETKETTVTETHSETHDETREGTKEETTTETHDEQKQETTSQVVQNKKNVWKFSFSPILSLDIQWPTKITALDSQFKTKVAAPSNFDKKIQVASSNGGFLVEKKVAVTGAIGGAVVAAYSAWTPGTALTLGMAPIVGTEKVYRTIVKTGAEAENVTVPATPSAMADLKKMKVGDSLSFAQMGGVMFSAGAAYVVVNVGVNLIAVGQWKTEIQKISDTRYYVNRSAVKMNNFGAAVGTTLTLAYTASQFKSSDSQFSWLFDTADAQAAKAMDDFVFKGIALGAQKMSDSKGQTTVLAVTKQDTVARGALRTISMGIPYVTASWGKGRINSHQVTQYFPDNTLGDANYAVYMKARDGRMFNWIENSTVAFTAARYNVRDANTKALQDSGYYGQFVFSYTDTHTRDSELQGAVNQLVAVTGLKNELYVEIPKTGNLGYSSVAFQLTLDKSATDFLMALAQDRTASVKLERDAQSFVTAYVRANSFNRQMDTYQDPIKMCGIMYDFHADACINQAQNATLKATGEVIVNLRDMKAALDRNDREAFAQSYADLGRAMTTSPFTFQAVLAASVGGTAGKGVMATYNVSGTRLKNYALNPTWDAGLVNEIFPLKK